LPNANDAAVRQLDVGPGGVQHTTVSRGLLEIAPFPRRSLDVVQGLLTVPRIGVKLGQHITTLRFLQTPTQDALPLPVDQLELTVGSVEIYHHGDVIKNRLQDFFLLLQSLFGLLVSRF
jgi:hypothetical protein